MNTPQRDPLDAMFDQYAATTAAETTRATPGQLRRRMHRHRTARVAAAGVAAAVLAVPGGWMLQQAGATDEPLGAADQGATSEEPTEYEVTCPVVALSLTPIVDPEGTDLNEFIDSEEVRAMMLALPEGSEIMGYPDDPEIKVVLIPGDNLEHYIDPEDYGVTVAVDETLSPFVANDLDVRAERLAAECADPSIEVPAEEGTLGDEPTESESEAGEESTGAGEEPTGVYEQSSPAGDESQTEESTHSESESPTPGDHEEVSASESSTP